MLRETLQSSSVWRQGDGGDHNEKDNDDDVNEKDDDDDDTAVLKFLAPR